jgi:hypothetical protein
MGGAWFKVNVGPTALAQWLLADALIGIASKVSLDSIALRGFCWAWRRAYIVEGRPAN